MQVPENEITWTYSLLNASESKENARTGTPFGSMAELVGIDGSNNGGLKPFAGFRKVRNFSPESATGWSDSNPYSGLAHKSRVVDFWSFSIVTHANIRVYGYVYVIRRPNNGSCSNVYDLLMDFYAPQGSTSAWRSVVIQQGMSDGGVLADNGSAIMSIETTGKAVYIFRRGVAPVAVYFKYTTGPVVTAANIVDPAGPGLVPKFTIGSTNYSSGTTNPYGYYLDPMNSANPPGSVVLNLLATGTINGATIVNLSTATDIQAGTYGFAVQFEDSKSGRKSQLSSNLELTFSGGSHRIMIEGIYNSVRFDTLNIYRSVRTGGAAGTFTAGILQLEASILLTAGSTPDYSVASSGIPVSGGSIPTTTGSAYFRYSFQLTDSALVMQDVFLDKPAYSKTMPKGGAGALLDGTMLVGNISENPGDLTGTGETRWSASGVDSPELFTGTSQYKPSNVGDAVTCFKRTGQIMAGFTRNGVHFFSKQDGFVRVLAAHQGYGITGPYAAATVGPVTYYLNYRGLKAVYPDGRLDDVKAINQLVSDEWSGSIANMQDLNKVSMAFDPVTLVLYILNPVLGHAVQFWFSTGVVSEMQDMSFGKVTSGWWEDTDGQLAPRAVFLYNAPFPDMVTSTSFRPAIYMPARSYDDKLEPEDNIDTPCCMLDANVVRNPTTVLPSNQATTTRQYYDSTCTLQTANVYYISNLFNTSNPEKLIGMWLYSNSPIGAGFCRARIVDATSSYVYFLQPEAFGTGTSAFSAGMNVSVDPIYLRWVGGPLRMTQDPQEELAIRQPTSLGVVISDFESTDGFNPVSSYWMGGLYKNNDYRPLLLGAPTLTSGVAATNSLSLGDSPNWVAFGKHSYIGNWFFPTFQTFIPNVQYRLVGAQVKGRMLPTDRTRRTY